VFKEKSEMISSSLHYASGEEAKVKGFIADLKRDPKVILAEEKGRMFFLLEKADSKAVKFFNPKLIFIKPVLLDKNGWETWEVGSWDKKIVSDFVNSVKKEMPESKLIKFVRTKLDQVFFPKLMPDLTEKQKRALELAVEQGFYQTPRKIGLRKLAEIMGVSLSTFEQHLQAAESKMMPNMLEYSK
jgi:predicted DNA binding protein